MFFDNMSIKIMNLKKILKDHKLWVETEGHKGSRANLAGAELSSADLSGADLSKANLKGAIFLKTDLSKANLAGADLSMANLSGANLHKAAFQEAELCFADLSLADLTEANLFKADLSQATLSGADLSGADLTGTNLTGVNLTWADLSWSELTGVNLTGANLSGVRLIGANLSLADLEAGLTTATIVDGYGPKKETGGVKHDQGKPDFTYLSTELLTEVAKVREFGAKKYARDNWKKGFKFTRSLAAALRHIFAFLGGEDKDPESGLLHLAHAVCCLEHCIYDYTHRKETNDDRYKS
jgi:uncharacterized protein YjbI with pentapeptide repeats